MKATAAPQSQPGGVEIDQQIEASAAVRMRVLRPSSAVNAPALPVHGHW
jgi:hypothetical protein